MVPMMKCGHSANAEDGKGNPVCVICYGIGVEGADKVDDNPVSLKGRKASCGYCKHEEDSSPDLAFFKSRPDCNTDSFYCGCYGWD